MVLRNIGLALVATVQSVLRPKKAVLMTPAVLEVLETFTPVPVHT
jgi:hypothetical protein